jgi:hypothetical protein
MRSLEFRLMFVHRLHRLRGFPISDSQLPIVFGAGKKSAIGNRKSAIPINLRNLWMYLFLVLALTLLACNDRPVNQPSSGVASTQPTTAPTPKTPFERDLQFIRNGQFTYVYVFSRKDGKPLDKDDAAYLRAHAPQVVDWVRTDDGKRAIGGTNFDLEQGGLPLLRKRFVVEDYTGR